MRQITFRGKRKDNGNWIIGSLLQSEIDVNQRFVKCEIHGRFADAFSVTRHEVWPETVGQATGLYDLHGQEIFEGDRLTCIVDGKEHGAAETVEFKNGAFVFRHRGLPVQYWQDQFDSAEVVISGNIYEKQKVA